jgi:hypothetical protein
MICFLSALDELPRLSPPCRSCVTRGRHEAYRFRERAKRACRAARLCAGQCINCRHVLYASACHQRSPGAWPLFLTFELQEVTSYHVEVPPRQFHCNRFSDRETLRSATGVSAENGQRQRDRGTIPSFRRGMARDGKRARTTTENMPGQFFSRVDPQTARTWQSAAHARIG